MHSAHPFHAHAEHLNHQKTSDYILDHETSLNKYQSIKIIWHNFKNHSWMNQEINDRKDSNYANILKNKSIIFIFI